MGFPLEMMKTFWDWREATVAQPCGCTKHNDVHIYDSRRIQLLFPSPCFDPLGPGGFAASEFMKEVTVCDGQSIGQPAAPLAAKSLQSCLLCATPWTAAHQAPPSMGFSRQECWSGVPLPSPAYRLLNRALPRLVV